MFPHKITFLFLLLAATATAQTRHIDLQTWKMGFLSPKGDTIIPVEYDFLPVQYAPRMIARKGEFRGVIDGVGNTLVPFEYQNIRLEKNGFVAVSKEQIRRPVWGLVNGSGELVLPVQYEYVAVLDTHLLAGRLVRSMVSICDAKGKLLFKTEGAEAMPGFDDRSVLIRKANRSTYWVDLEGNILTPPLFDNTSWSDGDYFIALQHNWYGVLNAKGDTVVPFHFRHIEPRNKGHFAVEDSTYRPSLIDSRGKTLAKGEYIRLGQEEGDVYSKRWSFEYTSIMLDTSGKTLLKNCTVYPVITEPQWNNLPENHYDRYSWVEFKKTKLRAFYRADGVQILPPLFKNILYCTDRHPLLGFILDEKRATYDAVVYDFEGKPLLEQRFANINFTEDPRIFIAKLTHDGLWGFVDLRAPEKAEYIYTSVDYQPNGSYIGIKNGEEVPLWPSGVEMPKVAKPAPGLQEVELFDAPEAKPYGIGDVQPQPSFPGGETALLEFITANLKYPRIAVENGVEGQVVVRFIVEQDGHITGATILRDIGGGCGQEALRLLQNMPNWEPGMIDGQPVRVKYTLPVRFKLK